jgi:LPS-assembly lipoprotein
MQSLASLLCNGATRCLCSSALLALAGCGFGLRQPPEFAFQSLYTGVSRNTPMGAELNRNLLALGKVQVITEAAQANQAQVILEIVQELREKVVVGVSPAGQVREFQIRIRLKFRVRTPAGKELIPETELLQQRDMSYSEAFALSKEAEEVLLYRNMQSDIVQQLLRRLAAINEL